MKLRSIVCTMLVSSRAASGHYNFIVMQPDDMEWLEEWGNAAHFDASDVSEYVTEPHIDMIPNINRLRTQGLQMTQAYTSSPMCGTSRYSTMTGRYPSRSSYGRLDDEGKSIRNAKIPDTKLEDILTVDEGLDCSVNNLAATFLSNNFHTAMIGKWHLSVDEKDDDVFNYTEAQQSVRDCGFEYAEAVYPHNLNGAWTKGYEDGVIVDHNMEHLTSKAIEFIDMAVNGGDEPEPFFMYFNPTVPHGGGNVLKALQKYDCRDTVEGRLTDKPPVPFGAMMGGYENDDNDCSTYRSTVLDRANGSEDDKVLGMIWVDDSVGAMLDALEAFGQLENTFFLFQMDHGQEGKGALLEPGIRIPQFVHFPAVFGITGATFGGLVSTIDIGATMLDFAGLLTDKGEAPYKMDGTSWKDAVINPQFHENKWRDRCLAFESGKERAFRCGCHKLLSVSGSEENPSDTMKKAEAHGLMLATDNNFYDLCSGDDVLEADGELALLDIEVETKLLEFSACHFLKTNPSLSPDYDTDCDTPVCEDTKDKFPHPTKADKTKKCKWVAKKNTEKRCNKYSYRSYCPATCGDC